MMSVGTARRRRSLSALLPALLLAACAGSGKRPDTAAATPAPSTAVPPMMQQIVPGPITLKEAFMARRDASSKLVSLAFVQNPVGAPFLYAADAATDDLVIFEAPTGRFISRFGKQGHGIGEFSGLTGLDAMDHTLFVAETGNRRIQMFYLPDNKPMASFGQKHLESPQAVFVRSLGLREFHAYVVDAVAGQLELKIFAVKSLAQDYKATPDTPYSVKTELIDVSENLLATVPLAVPAGTLVAVEADPANDRVLVVAGTQVLELDLEGKIRTPVEPLPGMAGGASGIGLFACPNDPNKGYWVVGDRQSGQQDFRVYDRATRAPLTFFRGEKLQDSGAMVLTMEHMAFFNFGATFALSGQNAVAALSWETLARQTGLRRICL